MVIVLNGETLEPSLMPRAGISPMLTTSPGVGGADPLHAAGKVFHPLGPEDKVTDLDGLSRQSNGRLEIRQLIQEDFWCQVPRQRLGQDVLS
jgi:hypothetical protein